MEEWRCCNLSIRPRWLPTLPQISDLIKDGREKRKWEFVFLAADEKGIQDGRSMGTTNFAYNVHQTKGVMRAAGMAVMNYCSTGVMGDQIDNLKDNDSK